MDCSDKYDYDEDNDEFADCEGGFAEGCSDKYN